MNTNTTLSSISILLVLLESIIHWPRYCSCPCLCCDSIWSLWVEANMCRFLSFVYICIAVGDPIIKRDDL